MYCAGLPIESIHLIGNKSKTCASKAFVKFSTMDAVECAIKRSDMELNIHIYRSTMDQMQHADKLDDLKSSPRSSLHDTHSVTTYVSKDEHSAAKFLKLRGIPWTASKTYIMGLFPGKYSFFV